MVHFFKLRALFALLCLLEYALSARNATTAQHFKLAESVVSTRFCFLAGPLRRYRRLPASFGLCLTPCVVVIDFIILLGKLT